MEPPKDDFGYWMGWAVAVGMACAFFVALLAKVPSVYELLCSSDDANCGREWFAATSGWVAALVAGITIYFLWLQINDAKRHNEKLYDAENKRKILVIKNARIQATKAIDMVEFANAQVKEYTGVNIYIFRRTTLRNIRDIIDSDEFKIYVRDIGAISLMSRNVILRSIDGDLEVSETSIDLHQKAGGTSAQHDINCEITFRNTIGFVERFSRALITDADSALAEITNMA